MTPDDINGGIISLSVSEVLSESPKGSFFLRYGVDAQQNETGEPVFYIDASDLRGLYNGVYGFLRRICGVEIYSTDVKSVPSADVIAPENP